MSRKIVKNNEIFFLLPKLMERLGYSDYKKLRRFFIKSGINKNVWDGWKKTKVLPANAWVQISEKTNIPLAELKGMINAGLEEVQNNPEEGREMRIKALLVNAEKILRSPGPFSEALERNIDAFLVGADLMEKQGNSHPQKVGLEESQ